jgi:cyclomaltodextrinase / maltogenic alpha-amylase / neopullulanase
VRLATAAVRDSLGMSEPPEWVRDAIFYQIFPDRFARSDSVPKPSNLEPWDSPPTTRGFKGGDLLGIAEHLDYLQELGITALYLNPIFRSTANHRYHTHDYLEVDPILGGNVALRRLLDSAHSRDMKVVLDGVFNHVGRGFYQFSHLLENDSLSPYLDWFRVYSWPLHPYGPSDQPPGYECWWNNRELPKLNTDSEAVRGLLWSVGEYWIREGIDGWRLDVPSEIDDDDFWRSFRTRIKHLNPNAYIVGEIWDDARRWLQGDQFDGVQNYLFTRACLGFMGAGTNGFDPSTVDGTGLDLIHPLDAGSFRAAIDSLLGCYSWPVSLSLLNQLDSHDTARFSTVCRGDESSFRLATLFQMTYPGAPCVYYGDEIGLQGGRDPDCRAAFPWEQSVWDESRRAYVGRCIELRKSYEAFRRGDYASLYSQEDVYVFSRSLGGEVAIVAINASHESRVVQLGRPSGKALTGLHSLWDGGEPRLEDGAIHDWELPARCAGVIVARVLQ